jgi:hypothetical protein
MWLLLLLLVVALLQVQMLSAGWPHVHVLTHPQAARPLLHCTLSGSLVAARLLHCLNQQRPLEVQLQPLAARLVLLRLLQVHRRLP